MTEEDVMALSDRSSVMRCEQCGREGTREFKVIGGYWDKIVATDNEPAWFPFVTVCANGHACRKRWLEVGCDDA